MTLGTMPNFNLVYLTVIEITAVKWEKNCSSSSILNEIIWQSLLNTLHT